jgi:hypothetical protein
MAQPMVLEGSWEEVLSHHSELEGKRVKLIVLPESPHGTAREPKKLQFGMFPQLQDLTEEDFKSAEWSGDH